MGETFYQFGKPSGEYPERNDDCYIYEVAIATGMSYSVLDSYYRKKQRELHADIPNDSYVVNKLLGELGYVLHTRIPGCNNLKRQTIRTFLRTHKGKYLIDATEHITYAENGKVIDSWDSSRKIINGYYTLHKNDIRNKRESLSEADREAVDNFVKIQEMLCLLDKNVLFAVGRHFGIKSQSFRYFNRFSPFLKYYLSDGKNKYLNYDEYLKDIKKQVEVNVRDKTYNSEQVVRN